MSDEKGLGLAIPFHIIGVAGVGMRAVAQLLLDEGCSVSGSDRHLDTGDRVDALDVLERAGVKLLPQDGSGLSSRETVAVVSTAIEDDNPDLAAARRLGCRVVHRAALLAERARGPRCLAVTGTSGKTTVTGMAGWILEQAGLDPTVVSGGAVTAWTAPDRVGSVRSGKSDLWVIEVDESDRSLLQFHPEWAILTNISKDHFELDETRALFSAFLAQVQGEVFCHLGASRQLNAKVQSKLREGSPVYSSSSFDWDGRTFTVPVPGAHNLRNAFLAAVACHALGVDLGRAQAALAVFPGVERRLEVVGAARGVRVLDDYAHNPAKIRAAWQAVASTAERVHAVWRPHGYGPLEHMLDELVDTFSDCCRPDDRLYLLPVYYAGGTTSRRVETDDLVRKLDAGGVPVELAPGYAELEARLVGTLTAGDTVLCMGARDPGLPRFCRSLLRTLEA